MIEGFDELPPFLTEIPTQNLGDSFLDELPHPRWVFLVNGVLDFFIFIPEVETELFVPVSPVLPAQLSDLQGSVRLSLCFGL